MCHNLKIFVVVEDLFSLLERRGDTGDFSIRWFTPYMATVTRSAQVKARSLDLHPQSSLWGAQALEPSSAFPSAISGTRVEGD